MSIKRMPDNLLICIMRQSWDGEVPFRSVQVQMCNVNGGGDWRSSRFIQQPDSCLTPFSLSPIPKGSSLFQPQLFIYFHKDKNQSVIPHILDENRAA